MKIGIDVSQVVYGTGVSKYTRNLVNALLKIDSKNEYILFGGSLRRVSDLKKFHNDLAGNSILKTFPISPVIADFIWNKVHAFPIENFVGEVDVFHSSDWSQPPVRHAKCVTTIHDLVPILYPEESHSEVVTAHKKRLRWVKNEVDRVIAVSESTKRDIVKHLGIQPEKIFVVYEAPDFLVKKMGEDAVGEVRRKYNLPREYLLAVGANPRKNIERIAKAARKFSGDTPLVVIGRKQGAFTLNERSEPKGNIVWLGHVSDDNDYAAIVSGASVLVYASLYEGFGLPILDAFTCEIPVVTSNISSMAEVAGNAAVLVDPTDIGDISRGVREALSKKNELIKKGLERIKRFSWETAARETLRIYEEVAK